MYVATVSGDLTLNFTYYRVFNSYSLIPYQVFKNVHLVGLGHVLSPESAMVEDVGELLTKAGLEEFSDNFKQQVGVLILLYHTYILLYHTYIYILYNI